MASAIRSTIEKITPGPSGPQEPSPEAVESLRQKFAAVNQEHVFTFWDSLSGSEKAEFFQQLSNINPERVAVCVDSKFSHSLPISPSCVAR